MRSTSLVILALIVLAFSYYVYPMYNEMSRLASAEQQLSQILKAETVRVLLNNRIVVRSVVTMDLSDILRGKDEVVAIGNVELHIGIDLSEASIEIVGFDEDVPNVTILLPNPKVIVASLDEDSFSFWRNATTLQRWGDINSTEIQSKVRKELKKEAEAFLRDTGQMPDIEFAQRHLKQVLTDFGFNGNVSFSVIPGS